MSHVLVLLVAIDVVVVIVLGGGGGGGAPTLLYIQGAGVTSKVLESITFVVQVGLYLYSFLVIRFDLLQVGLYLLKLFCCHLVIM
jgi:hypothetical protein